MAVERHLILQELILRPSGEWTPAGQCWTMARVAEGSGYWMQGGDARTLNPGDGLALAPAPSAGNGGRLRASQLGLLTLEWFTVQPQFLNGLLTVAEWHRLEQLQVAGWKLQVQKAAASAAHPAFNLQPSTFNFTVLPFAVNEPLGQKFAHLAHQTRSDGLPMRCALLQLWVSAVSGLLVARVADAAHANKLRERFRQHIGQMLEAELSGRTLGELAGQLHCSERHFSRLFREEFGVPLRARQIELRLQRAQQLLVDSDAKIINVAYESGYRHLGLFNVMFKKRFGMTPSEWRLSRRGGTRKKIQPRSDTDKCGSGSWASTRK